MRNNDFEAWFQRESSFYYFEIVFLEQFAKRVLTKIVKVLDGVHGHPAERFRVGVAVVQLVHVGVHGADVEEAVGDVEVEVAPDRDEQHPGHVEAEERPSSNGRTHPRSSV